ncbi:hypothetical protein LCGC14_2893630 [marine sediment metagenome]|uniref:HTH cro/C1-type domain-containing protein n=1 Tax=marine sediment metagenome TaxID=412755 RepID=A0A0F8XWI5_9ZZZZ
MKKNTLENFLENVRKTKTCWFWEGSMNREIAGYGQFRINGKRPVAHRISYELFVGKIPKQMLILHSCDNTLCVNPKHLRVGTQKENMRDRDSRGRNGLTKLTEKNVLEIRKIYASAKISQKKLALKFNVTQATISYIVLGKTWKHICTN